jgi:hypothetical protein
MKYVQILVAIVLLLVACAPVTPPAEPVPSAPAVPSVPPMPSAVTPAPVTTPPPASPTTAEMKALQALLQRADQRLKSYKYLEFILPDKKQPDTFFVKGTKIKIKLYEYEPYIAENYFDTVYLDTATKSIVARCENRKRCIWPRGDNTKREWTDLNFDQYRRKTPYEWVKEVPLSADIIGPEVHESRDSTKIEYDKGGTHYTMWIDNAYGIAVEVIETPATGKPINYKHNDVLFNTLSDNDVMPLS